MNRRSQHHPFMCSALLALSAARGACNQSSSNSATASAVAEPPLETDTETLDSAWACNEFENPDKNPVLLVHGTFTNGEEQWTWSYEPLLSEQGFDVCIVSYPDRGLGDLQVSSEYIVHAVRRIHALSGRPLAVIGHSQGGIEPRWAVKWWGSVRDAVDDLIMLAAPNHGTDQAENRLALLNFDGSPSESQMPAAFYQMSSNANFIAALNRDDETPGDISYTAIYTEFDELVQPVRPVPTAALEYDAEVKLHHSSNPLVSNILIQEVCPGRLVDHLTIGVSDRAVFALVLDALNNPGPTDVARAGWPESLCPLPVPDQSLSSTLLQDMLTSFQSQSDSGFSDMHLTNEEPELKPYAR